MDEPPILAPAWPRPAFRASNGLRTRQHYVALFEQACPEFEVDAARDGLPDGDPLAGFELEAFDDPGWVAGWSAGPLAAFLAAEPSVDAAAVRQARAGMGAWCAVKDPRTLAALQGGMALCRAFARAGAVAVLDVVALRWWGPAALEGLAPDRPFSIDEHVTFTCETAPVPPAVGLLCHTRGMAKFARPDLQVLVASRAEAQPAADLLRQVAASLALGLELEADATMRLADGSLARLEAHADDSGTASPLFFNRSLALVAAEGDASRPYPWRD